MHSSYVVPLDLCHDSVLYGGKAAGLARLIQHGFRVPPGVCLNTHAFRETLRSVAFDFNDLWGQAKRACTTDRKKILEDYRERIDRLTIPPEITQPLETTLNGIAQTLNRHDVRWAVRSSATNEDKSTGTFAGLYRTRLGVSITDLPAAIKECWASLMTPAALAYDERVTARHDTPAMAVIVQWLLSPRLAGVAYSQHPVTGRQHSVVINSVRGLAESLVSGQTTPDTHIVQINANDARVIERHVIPTQYATHAKVNDELQTELTLTDDEAISLARLIKSVEQAVNHPVDVEWALVKRDIWLVQARAIPARSVLENAETNPLNLTEDDCAWSRANFKETLPDQPSPLGLWFLRHFMETNILPHYQALGCTIPAGLSAVRLLHGRPYINVTLFQLLVVQLGSDPDLVIEHMGGSASLSPHVPRLPWWKLVKAGVVMEWNLRQTLRRAPRWFAEMKGMAADLDTEAIDSMPPSQLLNRLDQFGERLSKSDLTFAIVAGVSQGFSVLERLLKRRVGREWRALLNGCLQGLGTVISARQILRLAELAEIARAHPVVADFFKVEPWKPDQFRTRLAGTHFLKAFDAYLPEYGHRALGESDLMSPRFSETPEYVLGIIRGHVLSPLQRSTQTIRAEQATAREQALARLRTAFRRRPHEWQLIRLWLARLSRFLTLREANRHHLMYFTAAVRRVLLIVGRQYATRNLLNEPDDIFLLLPDEIKLLVAEKEPFDWKALIARRRAERAQDAEQSVQDFIPSRTHLAENTLKSSSSMLTGLSVSAGNASGVVRLVRNSLDYTKVRRGDIIVTPVLDPGMAPLLGIASGIVAEMGGILSHGAIIAREYGVPAVVNVGGVTNLLHEGESITLDATLGLITRHIQ